MTAIIISTPDMDHGNGAREALSEAAMSLPATPDEADKWADWVLIELWTRKGTQGPVVAVRAK
jgi:hypothetical protein